jgi:ABC-2 type transport system permease protein
MYKLLASIQKEVRLLTRDKVGLLLMFLMPVLLAVLIAVIQNNTFKLVNDNKVSLIIHDKDQQEISTQFSSAIRASGLFEVSELTTLPSGKEMTTLMKEQDALVAVVIPQDFSKHIHQKTAGLSRKIFTDLGLRQDSAAETGRQAPALKLYYNPVLQESFRQSIDGAIRGALQAAENKQLIRELYALVDEQKTPSNLEDELLRNQVPIEEIAATYGRNRVIPNATQHNIPAWTIFAMFFIVTSLGGNLVREKLNGSFVRLKTLPSSYLYAILAKQSTYLGVTLLQAAVIFAIGVFFFPLTGLPQLVLPADLAALFVVSLICGWCAVSYAICVGVFAQTQEQANGFGAVSIVILSAIGGLLIPSFAMPGPLKLLMKLSPLHWCLESYYTLFLEGGKWKDILVNIIPLLAITLTLQALSLWGLKRKKLI